MNPTKSVSFNIKIKWKIFIKFVKIIYLFILKIMEKNEKTKINK